MVGKLLVKMADMSECTAEQQSTTEKLATIKQLQEN